MFKFGILISGASAVFLAIAPGAEARTLVAFDAASLQDAIVKAQEGDEINIAPGDYGAIFINRNNPVAPNVTLTGMSAEERPVFSSIEVNGVGDLTFRWVRVEYGPTNAPGSSYAVGIYGAANVTFEQSEILSAADGVAGNDAYGVFVRNSTNVALLRNSIHDVYRGVAVFDSDDVLVEDNSITHVGADGLVGRGLLRAKIRLNYFGEFDIMDVNGAHPDAIQIWTRGAPRASDDIVIEGNIIRRGLGDAAQGILVGGPEFITANLLIAENVIDQSMPQGILVTNVAAASIRDNTVLPTDYRTDAPGVDIRSGGVTL